MTANDTILTKKQEYDEIMKKLQEKDLIIGSLATEVQKLKHKSPLYLKR